MKHWAKPCRPGKASALHRNAAMGLLVLLCTTCAHAQSTDTWEIDANHRIDQLHRRNLRVIVLDKLQQPAGVVDVNIHQRRHDMALGFAAGIEQLPSDILRQQHLAAPLYRVFNSVSLGDIPRWDHLEPEMGLAQWGRINHWLGWANDMGLTVRFGSVFSANPAHQADWISLLGRRDLMASIELHQRDIIGRYANRVIAIDLYSHARQNHFIEEQLSTVMLRRMYERASAMAPKVPMAIQMDDVLNPRNVQQAVARVNQLRQAFVPISQWSVSLHVPADVDPRQLKDGLDWLSKLKLPVVVSRLTFAANCDAKAVRTALTVLYAHPSVTGIYVGMPMPGDLDAQVNAPLVDARGNLTIPGKVIDEQFTQVWTSRGTLKTNKTGSVQMRVFSGLYDISAKLPSGRVAYTSVYVDSTKSDVQTQKVIVISPLAVSLEPAGR